MRSMARLVLLSLGLAGGVAALTVGLSGLLLPPPAAGLSSSAAEVLRTPPAEASHTPAPAVPTPAPYVDRGDAVVTRVRVPALQIDLPVVSGDLALPGARGDHYPYCDVAQYLVTFSQPGRPGTTYLYAHARGGMFWPLLAASWKQDGAALLGQRIEVYTNEGVRFDYEISIVKRHVNDFSLAEVFPGEQRLILQTSEGSSIYTPKLQVAARPVGEAHVQLEQAVPQPRPRVCA